jgi:hypothetical protein
METQSAAELLRPEPCGRVESREISRVFPLHGMPLSPLNRRAASNIAKHPTTYLPH